MKLTDEMILKSKVEGKVKGFIILDENYIVIQDAVQDIIEKTQRLRNKGVNYCGPIDCREVDGTSYALEHRAPGKEINHSDRLCDTDVNNANEYISIFSQYMSELKKLSLIPQKQYLKFFDDIEELRKEKLKPDCCSLGNLFYDKNVGFSFIDVYPIVTGAPERLSIQNIFYILLNRRFSLPIDGERLSVIPASFQKEYDTYISDIFTKILIGLRQYGYPQDEIKQYIASNRYTFTGNDCLTPEEIQHRIDKLLQEHEHAQAQDSGYGISLDMF